MNCNKLFNDLKSDRYIVPAVCLGLTIGTLIVIIEISFAAMLYSGPLAFFVPQGAALTLAGSLFIGLIASLGSSFKGMVSIVQSAPVAALAAATASVLAATSSTEAGLATVNALVVISGLCTGAACIALGHFNLGNMIRFMPYPVVGGFLAGTGWLLTRGSFGVMTGLSLSWQNLPLLFTAPKMLLWVPGVLFALLLVFVVLRSSYFFALPLTVACGIMACFALLWVNDISMSQATSLGIFSNNLPPGRLLPDFPSFDPGLVDWKLCLNEAATVATVVIVSLVALLLNTNGIELVSKEEIDLNQELQSGGIGNILAALVGSPPGCEAPNLVMLGIKTRIYSRWTGIFSCLVILCVMLMGGNILSFLPKPLLGSMLLMLGIFFLKEWIVDARSRLDAMDYGIVWAIVLTIALLGFLQGVGLGLLLAIIILVIRLSGIPAADQIQTGSQIASHVSRPPTEQAILKNNDKRVLSFDLRGYLFFGTSTLLIRNILETIDDLPLERPGFVILNFTKVDGIDISAINNFQRLLQTLELMECTLIVSGPPLRFQKMLDGDNETAVYFKDHDASLQWVEEKILALDREIHRGQDSLTQKNRRNELFEQVAVDYLEQFDTLHDFEILLASLEPVTRKICLEREELLVSRNQTMKGLYIWEWGQGEVVNDRNGESRRIRGVGPGDAVGMQNAFASSAFPYTVKALSRSTVVYLAYEDMVDMEQTRPEIMSRLYRLLMVQTGKRLRG